MYTRFKASKKSACSVIGKQLLHHHHNHILSSPINNATTATAASKSMTTTEAAVAVVVADSGIQSLNTSINGDEEPEQLIVHENATKSTNNNNNPIVPLFLQQQQLQLDQDLDEEPLDLTCLTYVKTKWEKAKSEIGKEDGPLVVKVASNVTTCCDSSNSSSSNKSDTPVFVAFDLEQWYVQRAISSLINETPSSETPKRPLSSTSSSSEKQQDNINYNNNNNYNNSKSSDLFYNDFTINRLSSSTKLASPLNQLNLNKMLLLKSLSSNNNNIKTSSSSASSSSIAAIQQFNKYQICFT